MKYLILCICFYLNQAYSQSQAVYKLEDLGVFVKVFSKCKCGDYVLDDSTVLEVELIKGKSNDSLMVNTSRNFEIKRYLILTKFKYFTVKQLIYKGAKKKYRIRKIRYFQAIPLIS
jgi:hypothetical protein